MVSRDCIVLGNKTVPPLRSFAADSIHFYSYSARSQQQSPQVDTVPQTSMDITAELQPSIPDTEGQINKGPELMSTLRAWTWWVIG